MKELNRFRQFLNEGMDPIGLVMDFVSKIKELLNDPKAGTHPKMLNYVLELMNQFAPFMDVEEYVMHVEQASQSLQQGDMEGTKTHLLQALDSGEAAYKNQADQYLNENEDKGKTISLYPFYNEELAQKLFAMGIKDGYDWDDFLVRKLRGLWKGDPEGDGTMMYNVQEPLYTELKTEIKSLVKQIMAGMIDEARYPKFFFPSMEKETARSKRHNLADVVMTRLEHEIEDGKTSGVFRYLDYSEGYSDDSWFFMLIRYLYREMNNKAFINPTIQDGVEVLPRVELNFDENSGNISWNVA